MDVLQLHTELAVDIPAEGRANEAGAEVVHAILGIAQHDGEVFRDVVEQDVQRMHLVDDGLFVQDAVVKDVAFAFRLGKGEVLGIPGAEKLQGVLHDFLAGQFATGEVIEYKCPVFFEKLFAICNPGDVAAFEF